MHDRPYHATRPLTSSQSKISYHLAVSSSGKGRAFDPERNVYDFNPFKQEALGVENGETAKVKKRNRPDSGEDAFFVAKVGRNDRSVAFGIADGVGGWNTSGVDPADFSHGLCSYMAQTALGWNQGRLSPKALMEAGFQQINDDDSVPAGGSTACVSVVGEDGRIDLANLGDSGFLQLRLGAVQHYSNPQTHAFNTPYQLSIIPPKILAQSKVFGGTPLSDLPKDASMASHTLQHGDVLLLATDGVWDNLNSQDVLNIVTRQMLNFGAWASTPENGITVTKDIAAVTKPGGIGDGPGEHTLQGALAVAVAGEAKLASVNNRRDGPFAKEVQKYYPEEGYHGGKVDDICVVVLVAIELMKDAGSNIKSKL